MPQHQPISRLATTMGALALAFAATFIHADSFSQTNLVSDVPGLAANTDPNLKNPWGVAFSATSPFWTSDQVTGLATLYNAAGTPQALVVTIPGGAPPSGPTGTVFSGLPGSFLVNGTPALFIFDTLHGTLAGWNASAGTTAVQMAATSGAIYTGLDLPLRGQFSARWPHQCIQFDMGAGLLTRDFYRPDPSGRLGPLQHPEHRRQPLRNLRPAWPRWNSSARWRRE